MQILVAATEVWTKANDVLVVVLAAAKCSLNQTTRAADLNSPPASDQIYLRKR